MSTASGPPGCHPFVGCLLATQEQLRGVLHLHQAVVCAAENRLCLADRVDLTRARLLADLEVLEEEIAVAVELGDAPRGTRILDAQNAFYL